MVLAPIRVDNNIVFTGNVIFECFIFVFKFLDPLKIITILLSFESIIESIFNRWSIFILYSCCFFTVQSQHFQFFFQQLKFAGEELLVIFKQVIAFFQAFYWNLFLAHLPLFLLKLFFNLNQFIAHTFLLFVKLLLRFHSLQVVFPPVLYAYCVEFCQLLYLSEGCFF